MIEAMHQVVDQVTRWNSLDHERVDSQAAIELAQRNLNMSDTSYKAGLSDYREVLVARLDWLRQQQGDVAILYGVYGSYAGLVQSLGGEFAAHDQAAKAALDATQDIRHAPAAQ